VAYGSSARLVEDPAMIDETTRTGTVPPSEQSRYEPRFRVVTRKSMVPKRKPAKGGSLSRLLLLTVVPAFGLVVYVLFWTLAMRGGYYKNTLEAQIKQLRIEHAELQAEKRRHQSPAIVLEFAAKELKMQPASRRQFAELPARAPQKGEVR
jgi:hypothetical protein